MSKKKNYLIGGAAAADEYIDLETLIPEIKGIHIIENSHTETIKDKLVGKLKIPEHITKIDNDAFKNCSKLTDIVFPNNLKDIGLGAFYDCTGITTIIFPDSLEDIGDP